MQVKTNEKWEDLNYDEKIERIARLATTLFQEIAYLREELEVLRFNFSKHRHDENNDIYRKEYLNHPNNLPTLSQKTNSKMLNPLHISDINDTKKVWENEKSY